MTGDLAWARLDDDVVLVAGADGAWSHPRIGGGPFERPMDTAAARGATQRLLDGAVRVGQLDAGPPVSPPPTTLWRWAWDLCAFHQTTDATTRLMDVVTHRFAAFGLDALAAWSAQKATEEAGHDVLALRDLEALGFDADATVRAVRPPRTAALAAFFEAEVHVNGPPFGVIGYAYALERLAGTVTAERIARVEEALPDGVLATRCLRVHSAVGGDAHHWHEAVDVTADLDGEARETVLRAARRTACLATATPPGEEPTEAQLQALLGPMRRNHATRKTTTRGASNAE